ncbi:hypothetical protein CMO91_02125 [Candidatus Woesearchaeota archaeon]|nr:hypothetical protein [Candidatus Woesearchaeota archaeon]
MTKNEIEDFSSVYYARLLHGSAEPLETLALPLLGIREWYQTKFPGEGLLQTWIETGKSRPQLDVLVAMSKDHHHVVVGVDGVPEGITCKTQPNQTRVLEGEILASTAYPREDEAFIMPFLLGLCKVPLL